MLAATSVVACMLHVKAHMSEAICQGGLACSQRSTALMNISIIVNILPNQRGAGTHRKPVKCKTSLGGERGGDLRHMAAMRSQHTQNNGRGMRDEKSCQAHHLRSPETEKPGPQNEATGLLPEGLGSVALLRGETGL